MFTATNLLGVVCQSAFIWWRSIAGTWAIGARQFTTATKAMGEFVVRVADAFGLEHPHVVGRDVETGASLFVAELCTQGSSRVLQ